MTMDLLCALLLFAGNVGHLGVLSYKVLKFSELEVGSQPLSCTVRTRPGVQCAVTSDRAGAVRHKPPPPRRSRILGFGCTPLPDPPSLAPCIRP